LATSRRARSGSITPPIGTRSCERATLLLSREAPGRGCDRPFIVTSVSCNTPLSWWRHEDDGREHVVRRGASLASRVTVLPWLDIFTLLHRRWGRVAGLVRVPARSPKGVPHA
jgi:hypothetical protein